MSTKTIRLTDEVLKWISAFKVDEKQSMSDLILFLLHIYYDDYAKRNGEGRDEMHGGKDGFDLINAFGDCIVPKYTKFDNIVRISQRAYDELIDYKIHIDESFNTALFRLAAYHDFREEKIKEGYFVRWYAWTKENKPVYVDF